MRVPWPDFEIPPIGWRTRIHDLEADLASEGPIASDIREIRRIAAQEGDLAAQEATSGLVERHTDLFPGEAGWSLAWSIVCDAVPQVEVATGPTATRRPFEEPLPEYAARHKRGSRNRFQARPERAADENQRLLDLLQGGLGKPPQTLRRAARELRWDSTKFHKRLETLKKLGVRVRDKDAQNLVAAIFEPWRFRFKGGKVREHAGSLSKDKAIPMTFEEATWRTGKALSDLLDTYRCETYTKKTIDDPIGREMIKVPPELILFPPLSDSLDEHPS